MVEEIKRLNFELSKKIQEIKLPEINKASNTEYEIECLKKTIQRYEREVKDLNAKLIFYTSSDRIKYLEDRIQENKNIEENTLQKIKELEKKLKATDNLFTKQARLKDAINEKLQVLSLF